MFESKSDFKVLSEISRDIAQVFFASAVISPLTAGLDLHSWPMVVLGLAASIFFWGLSLESARKGDL